MGKQGALAWEGKAGGSGGVRQGWQLGEGLSLLQCASGRLATDEVGGLAAGGGRGL